MKLSTAISCAPLAFALLSVNSFGQGCSTWMNPGYSTYQNATNPNGNQITTTVTVDGTTTGTCPLGCSCLGIVHTPRAYNVIGSTGGWNTGSPGPWNSYISDQNVQTLAAQPGILYTNSWIGEVLCSAVGTLYLTGTSNSSIAGYTPVQHTYPRSPLPSACFVSSYFDSYRGGVKHRAEDVVNSDGKGGGAVPAYGTSVYAMESGKVIASVGTNGPASTQYPQCSGAPGNYVKIQTGDNYSTVYFHMKPAAGINVGTTVAAGQLIGALDNSGCQTHAHLHVARKDPNGILVNLRIPCTNPDPTNTFDYGIALDADPTDW